MTTRVVVVGAGGLGREVLDVVESRRQATGGIEVFGVVDDNPSEADLERLRVRGHSYLGTIEQVLSDVRAEGYVVGIGTPEVRRNVARKFDSAGWHAVSVVHPDASLGSEVAVEPGVVVCAGARVTTNTTIEAHALLNLNVTVGHDSRIGAFSVVNPGAHVSGDVAIQPVVLIGTGSVILQGIQVAEGAIIGANACVTKDIEAYVTVIGIPARPLATRVGG